MRKLWVLFCTLFSVIFLNEAFSRKKVCVIGAGRAGLAAIKLVADQTDKFEPIAFERNPDVGGLWIYREHPKLDENGLPAHSGIYKSLRTITSKELMTYPDYRTFDSTGDDDNGTVSHERFLKYMRNYTDHFELRQYIQLNTLVTKITPLKYKCTRNTTRWNVERRNLKTHENITIICDAVIVSNGRYSKPNEPKIPGIDTFHGRVIHSRSYRIPQKFIGKKVIVLGAQSSGSGIARDLSYFAKTVYLSCRKPEHVSSDEFPKNVIVVNEVIKAFGNQFTLEKGSTIIADAFIFCTGYVYDFPFLDENSGIEFDDKHLYDLSESFINEKYPSMALIGVGNDDGFADLYYAEAKSFLKSLQG